jgi:hypothetical protein
MGQSKQPARCVTCGAEGPRRPEAARQGWYSRGGLKPEWYCPEHAGPVREADEERRRQLYARSRALSLGLLGTRMAYPSR